MRAPSGLMRHALSSLAIACVLTACGGGGDASPPVANADSGGAGNAAVVPADGNLFQSKVPAAVYVGNGCMEAQQLHRVIGDSI